MVDGRSPTLSVVRFAQDAIDFYMNHPDSVLDGCPRSGSNSHWKGSDWNNRWSCLAIGSNLGLAGELLEPPLFSYVWPVGHRCLLFAAKLPFANCYPCRGPKPTRTCVYKGHPLHKLPVTSGQLNAFVGYLE